MRSILSFLFIISFNLCHASKLESWQGTWIGPCSITNTNSLPQEINMRLSVEKIDSDNYDWHIQYRGEETRRYIMKKAGSLQDEDHYILDERNGIFIDRFLEDNEMRDMFHINGKVFVTTTTNYGERIVIRGSSYWSQNPRVSKLQSAGTQVLSFYSRGRTSCELEKQ